MRVMKQGRDGGGKGRGQNVHLAVLLLLLLLFLLLLLLLSPGPLKQLQGAPPVALLPGPFSGAGQAIQGWDEWMNGCMGEWMTHKDSVDVWVSVVENAGGCELMTLVTLETGFRFELINGTQV